MSEKQSVEVGRGQVYSVLVLVVALVIALAGAAPAGPEHTVTRS